MKKNHYLLLTISLFSVVASGCASLTSLNGSAVPTPPTAGSKGSFTVSVESGFSSPKVYTGSVDDTMTIQKALEVSGATKKHRSPEIEILRRVEESGRGLRMQVDYDVRKKQVRPEQNYAILPGDRIVVRSKESSPLGSFGKYLGL